MPGGGDLLLRDAVVDGSRADVRIRDAVIVEVGRSLRHEGEPVLDVAGGEVLPGLHDHHVHLLAVAAALASVPCGPRDVHGADGLAAALRGAAGDVRGVGYHESVAGPLDRDVLDRWVPDRPVRVQHRSGAAWFLNSVALSSYRLLDAPDPAVERDATGRATGVLRRGDHLVRDHAVMPDLAPVGRLLAAYGVTGVTDATPALDATSLRALRHAPLPQHVVALGAPLDDVASRGVPWKIVLDEAIGLDLDAVIAEVAAAHAAGRPVAVHAVTEAEAVVAIAALRAAGALAGDRIEHGSLLPRALDADLARFGVTVVTQPHFLTDRGDDYLRDVEPRLHAQLYRCRSLLDAGIAVAAGTDAPYGDPDPWRAIAAATTRRTRAGAILGPDETVSPRRALGLFLGAPLAPDGPPRRVAVGAPADLCILSGSLDDALADPGSANVATTVIDGRVV